MNPVLARELTGHLRTGRLFRQLFLLLAVTSFAFCGGYEIARNAMAYQNLNGRSIFFVIVYLSTALVIPVTSLTAASITREREAGTLDLLLTTPLTPRSILWGKMLAVSLVFLLMLCGCLPILSLCLILGGLSPDEYVQCGGALAGFFALAASLGLAVSLISRTSETAAKLAVLALLLYILAPFAARVAAMAFWGPAFVSSLSPLDVSVNPYLALYLVQDRGILNPLTVTTFQYPKLYFLAGLFSQWPGWMSGVWNGLLAFLLFLAAVWSFHWWMLYQPSGSALPGWFRRCRLDHLAARTPFTFHPLFGYHARAVYQRENLANNRRFFSRDSTQIAVSGLIAWGLVYSLFINPRGIPAAPDFTPIYDCLNALGILLAFFYSPIPPAHSLARERLRDTWPLLRTTSLHSRDIVLGKIFSAFRRSAILLVSGYALLCGMAAACLFLSGQRPVEWHGHQILILLAFYLVCIFFYACLGVYHSGRPAAHRKTSAAAILHLLFPFLLFGLYMFYHAMWILAKPAVDFPEEVFRFFSAYIFPFAPFSYFQTSLWDWNTYIITGIHITLLALFGLALIHRAGRRVQDYDA
ncbi:MAG: ABC transporter permease subunit [bacterium]